MAKKKSAEVGLTLDISGFRSNINELNKSLNTNRNQLKLNAEQLKLNADSTDLLTDRQTLLEQGLASSTSKVKECESALEKIEATVGKNSKEYYNWTNALLKAKTEQQAFENQLNGVKSKIEAQSNAVDELADHTDELSESFDDVGDKASVFGDVLEANIATDVLKEGLAATKDLLLDNAVALDKATNSLLASTGSSKEYVTELEDGTEAIINQGDKFKEMMQSIYESGFGESFDDISESLSQTKKQMGYLNDADLEKVTKSALSLRDVFGYDVQEQVRAANSMVDAFGVDANDAFNLIAQGAQNGLDYSGELLDSIVEYSPQFKKLGLDAEDMFQVFQSGTDAGAFNLDKIGDAVKELSIRVIDGSETTKEGFALMGLNANEMANKFAQGGETAKLAFQETIEALTQMQDPIAQSTAGVNLFGTMWEDLGADVVLSLAGINDGIDITHDAIGEINALRFDDLNSQMELLKRGIETDIAGALNTYAIPALTDSVKWLNENKDLVAALGLGIGAMVVTIGGATVTLGIYNGVMDFMAVKSGAATVATTGLGAALTFLTGPIGIASLAIGGVVTAGVLMYQNWETISQAGMELWEGVSNTFEDIKNSITEKINAAKETVWNVIESIKSFFNFEWSLPGLKLPHISISGEFSLMPPRVPRFGIEWYAKGALFTGTTILPGANGLNGFGEAGLEYALPLNDRTLTPLAELLAERLNYMDTIAQQEFILYATIPVNVGGVGLVEKISKKIAIQMKRGRR